MSLTKTNSVDEVLNRLSKYISNQQNEARFVQSLTDLTLKCAPRDYFKDGQPQLKHIWKFIKKMMEE